MKKTLLACISGIALLASCSFENTAATADYDVSRSATKSEKNYKIGSRNILSFDPQKEMIYNPDMGFYNAVKITIYNRVISSENGQPIYAYEIEKDKRHLFQDNQNKGLKINGESGSWSEIIKNSNFDLLNLKFDISDFSSNSKNKNGNLLGGTDTEFDETYLKNCMDDILGKLEALGKTAFVGFAYCWDDPKGEMIAYEKGLEVKKTKYLPTEPSDFNIILNNINHICSALKGHERAITGIMARTLGPWGEMHGTPYCNGGIEGNNIHLKKQNDRPGDNLITVSISEYCERCKEKKRNSYFIGDVQYKPDDYYFIRQVIGKWLESMEQNDLDVPYLLRQPAFLEDYEYYYEGTKPANWEQKVGLYNGAIFANFTDMETFKDYPKLPGEKDKVNYTLADIKNARRNDIEKISKYTRRTPYGSEISNDHQENKESGETHDYFLLYNANGLTPAEMVEEMNNVHLSFANVSYKEAALKEMAATRYNSKDSVFSIMAKNMGYRFNFKDRSVRIKDGVLKISFNIENSGFANMPYHRKKYAYVVLVKKGSEVKSFIPGILLDEQQILDSSFESNTSKRVRYTIPVETKDLFVTGGVNEPGEYDVYIRFDDKEYNDGKYAIRFAGTTWNETLKANLVKTITISE